MSMNKCKANDRRIELQFKLPTTEFKVKEYLEERQSKQPTTVIKIRGRLDDERRTICNTTTNTTKTLKTRLTIVIKMATDTTVVAV